MAVRINRRVSEILAAHVHVRHQVHDPDVLGRGPTGAHLVVGIARRYREAEVSGRTAERLVLEGAAGEDQADGSPVRGWFAVGRVVQLEEELGPGLQQLGGPRRVNFGLLARCEPGQFGAGPIASAFALVFAARTVPRGENKSEEHTSELQSPCNLVCRLLLEKKKN